MKKLNNLKTALLGLSFVFWLVTSFINPITNLFESPNTYEYIVGFNIFIVIGYFIVSVVPRALKNNTLGTLNFKSGPTKKSKSCSSCKKKKKSE